MKNRVFGRIRKFTPVIMAIVYICIIALFTSCEGFINSKDTSRQIENYIEYANSQSYHITIKDSDGNGTIKAPVGGETYKKVTDTFTINYGPFEDYEFLCWKIIDGNTKQEFPNGEYLTITSITDKETECTFTKAPGPGVELCLVPEVVARPETLSKNPEYKSTGVNWDSRIFVQFDKDMDPNSIYYTEPEYEAKKVELGITEEIDSSDIDPDNLDEHDNVFLCVDKNENPKRYYGYIKDGDTVFKNIQITNYSNTSENLLKYFKAPRFEDSKRLSISPITKKVNDKNQPVLGSGKTIFVTLDKNFYYSASIGENNSKPVTMRKPVSWNYLLNNSLDGTGPIVSTVSIQDMNGNYVPTSSSSTPCYLNNSKKLKFYISVQDDDSGPASDFKMLLKKTGYTEVKTIPIKYENADGNYATSGNSDHYYECVIDDIPSDVDGDYEFKLQFYDNSENETNPATTYYVSIDGTAPDKTKISTCLSTANDISNTSKTAISFDYTCSEISDYKKIELYYREAVPTSDSAWYSWDTSSPNNVTQFAIQNPGNNKQTITITGLDYSKTYEIKAVYFDKAGNTTTCYYKKSTKPKAYQTGTITPFVLEQARSIKIPINNVPEGANKSVLLYKKTGDSDFTEKEFENNQSNAILYIRNMVYAKTYEIKIKSRNFETIENDSRYENRNQTYTDTNDTETLITNSLKTKPAGVTNCTYQLDSSYVKKVTFTLEGDFTGVKYWYKKFNNQSGQFASYGSAQTNTNKEISIILDQYDSLYRFKFQPYYDNQSNVCDDVAIKEVDITTGPAPQSQSQPTSISVNTPTTTGVTATLKWNRPSGTFAYYKITWQQYSGSNRPLHEAIIEDTTANSFTITGLAPSTKYEYRIYCYSESDSSLCNSATNTFTTTTSDQPLRISQFEITSTSLTGLIARMNISIKVSKYTGTLSQGSSLILRYSNYSSSLERESCNYISTDLSTEANLSLNTDIYYLQYYTKQSNKYKAVSDIFVIGKPYSINSNIYYYIKNYSYNLLYSNGNYITLNWTWNQTQNVPTGNFCLWYREIDSNSSWNRRDTDNNSNNITWRTNQINLGGSTGKSYEVKITADSDSDKIYGYASYTIPGSSSGSSSGSSGTTGVQVYNLKSDSYYKKANSVRLTWNAYADCNSYNVYDVTESSSPVLVADGIPQTQTNVTLVGLTPKTRYKFTVVPHKNGEDDALPKTFVLGITTGITPPNVTNLNYELGYENTKCLISWDTPSGYSETFKIKVYYKLSTQGNGQWISKITSSSSSSLVLTELFLGTKYDIKVTTLYTDYNNPDYDSEESKPVTLSFYTKPDKPQIEYESKSSSSIKIGLTYPSTGNYSKLLLTYKKSKSGDSWDYEVPVKIINKLDYSKPTEWEFTDLEPNCSYNFTLYSYSDENMTISNSHSLFYITTQ